MNLRTSDGTSTIRPSRSLPDPVVGIAVGLVGGAAFLHLPPILAIGLLVGLLGFGVASGFDQVNRMATSLMILSAFTMPMGGVFIAGLPLPDIVLPIALAAVALVRIKNGTRRPDGNYRFLLLGVGMIALSGLIGAIFEAPGPFFYAGPGSPPRDVSGWGQNIGNLVKFILGSTVPIFLWVLASPTRALCKRMAGAFLVGSVLSVLVGLLLPFGRGGGRWLGLAVSPIPFGEICLLALGPAVAFILIRRQVPMWSVAVVPLLGLGIVMSGSRSALGAMVLFLAIIGPLTKNRLVIGAIMSGIAVALLVLVLGLVTPQGESALSRMLGNTTTAQNSDSVRSDLARDVLERFWERPITGNGLNYMRPSHNFYLGLLASGGALGLAGFFVIAGGAAYRLWVHRTDVFVVAIAASFLGYLAAAYFDYTFWWRWLWFYIGMVYAVSATAPTRETMLDDAHALGPPPESTEEQDQTRMNSPSN